MLSADQLLVFTAGMVGLFALVPLSIWFATGSRAQAVRALRGYGAIMGGLALLGVFGAVVGVIAARLS